MRIPKPNRTCSTREAHVLLRRTRPWFYKTGANRFLSYYQDGKKRKRYVLSDISDFIHWLMVREGLIALGHLHEKSPVLPPGETMEAKRATFEAWLKKDPHGATCPRCAGPAVQRDGTGPVWCKGCGISD